jgi:hypothetical protein
MAASQTTSVNVRVENYKTVKEFVYALTKNLAIRGNKNGHTWRTCRGEGIGFLAPGDMTVELVLLGTDTYRKHTEAAVLAFVNMLTLGEVKLSQPSGR